MSFEDEMPILRAQSSIAGSMLATSGALLMKALAMVTGIIMRTCASSALRGRRDRFRMIRSSAPVSRRAAVTMNSTPIVRMPSLAKPASASFGVRTPHSSSTHRPAVSTRSAPIRVKIIRPMQPP
jgi:hypothetical protein